MCFSYSLLLSVFINWLKTIERQCTLILWINADDSANFPNSSSSFIMLRSFICASCWRLAYITPVFSKDDPACDSNYWPTSLTSIICKLVELIIKDIKYPFLLAAGGITKHQHAFITKQSNTTNVLESTYDWTATLNNLNPVDILYIDFSTDFDSVAHSKFISRRNAAFLLMLSSCVCVCLFVCLSVCICVSVYRVCGPQENGVR